MPMALARKKCPEAIVVPPRFDAYVAASRKVREVFDRFSPLVEPLSIDEAFLDLTGSRNLLGPPEEVGRRIKAEVREATGLAVSVGIAPCKYVAKVASDVGKPDGLLIVALDEVLDFLSPLPISRLWGVGPKTAPRLLELGLTTIGEVAAADPGRLEAELGELGVHISRLARGDDPREVVPDREAKSVGWERTLDVDVRGEEAILPHLRRSADEVAWRLRREGLRAMGVRLKLKSSDFVLHTRQCRLRLASDTADDLFAACKRLMPEVNLALPMRLIGLAAFDLVDSSAPEQQDLFLGSGRKKRSKLDQALDEIDQRFGRGSVQRASEVGARTKPTEYDAVAEDGAQTELGADPDKRHSSEE